MYAHDFINLTKGCIVFVQTHRLKYLVPDLLLHTFIKQQDQTTQLLRPSVSSGDQSPAVTYLRDYTSIPIDVHRVHR